MTPVLHYTHYPHPSSQSWIIIHGLLGCKDNWRNLAKKLSLHSNIYCVDCRNHGESFHNDSMTYEQMSQDIEQLLQYLSLDKVSIIGHSMGGKIAMHSIQQNPSRYDKAVIIDIAPKEYDHHHHQSILAAMQSINLTNMQSRTAIDTALATSITDQRIRHLVLKNIKRNQNNHFYWQCNIKAIQTHYSAIMANSLSNTLIDIPSLFIRGEQSCYINQSNDIARIKSLFSQASITTVKGAGHWVQTEKPTEFTETAIQFLS